MKLVKGIISSSGDSVNWAKWGNEKAESLSRSLRTTNRLRLIEYCDTNASATDTTIPDSEVANNHGEADASNSSASAIITIRMYTLLEEEWS